MALRIGLPGSSALQHDGLDVPVILQCRTPQEYNPKDNLGPTYFVVTFLFLFSFLVVLVYFGSLKEAVAPSNASSPARSNSTSASDSSSDSSSSSRRNKKKSKKSKREKKQAKKAKHDKKKKVKHDRKRKLEETPAEMKVRLKIEKTQNDANKKVCIARTKSAEQVLGKLSPNIVSIAGTVDKPAMEHIPDLVKLPMNNVLSELKTIEDNAASIVHEQGSINIELPDLKVTLCS
jgi:hypothetical protein